MSSIYRKGRDGYFYYQAYIKCPTTGKKEKRVFKSLGTKDEIIAKSKQMKLDKIYENDFKGNRNGKWYFNQNNYFKLLGGGFVLLTFYFILNNLIDSPKDLVTDLKNDTQVVEGELTVDSSHSELIVENVLSPKIGKNKIPVVKVQASALPKYSIEKIQSLSNSFSQGKIYALVDDSNAEPDRLKLLCKKIADEYPEYKNIVICLYANNIYGKEIIHDNVQNIADINHNKSWLAFYTYNDVEGEYFDENPGGYLGGN